MSCINLSKRADKPGIHSLTILDLLSKAERYLCILDTQEAFDIIFQNGWPLRNTLTDFSP